MTFIIAFLLVVSCFLESCNSCSRKDSKDGTPVADTVSNADSLLAQWDYANDSGEVTMMVFGDDGKVEYVVDRPENVFHTTESGIEYKIAKQSKSKKSPRVGDVLFMDMEYRTEQTDSLMFSSKDLNEEFKFKLSAPNAPGCIEEAFMLLHEGDSAIIKVDAINFFLKSQGKVTIPSFIKKGERMVFTVNVKKIVSGLDYANANKDQYAKRIEEENSMINRFLLNIEDYPSKKTDSGLHILTINAGGNKKPSLGSTVTINYTAAFIDGSIFDSTFERSEPFSFVTGKKQVIEGLDEAVMNMTVGSHCLVIIPFRLAYGDQKYGNIIPPFSTLVFEIELVDAK
ncbi:MAG: FKBP-type peptidyl-prolyl cis-trans isomerase [Bacteroidales bacterium]|nr:FKBP-type peptidyl-prolyl cis-trans isomerase [Bacteroidales bacterium]